ncbi:MAG: flagellar biosynthesis repressor FlbT [Pseudomonadota bacterium]
MAGLLLNLKPYEKFLVGGIVLQNGQRRSQLRILDDKAGVLRLSEALHPDRVKTPLTRAYYAAQSIVVGDESEVSGGKILRHLLEEALRGFEGFDFAETLHETYQEAEKSNYYKVLKLLHPLLAKEAALLLQVNKSDPAVND